MQVITQVMRIWPHPPKNLQQTEGWINLHAGNYQTAEGIYRKFLQPGMKATQMNRMAHLGLILSLMFQGREAEARSEAEDFRKIPEYPFKKHVAFFRRIPFKDPQRLERELAMWRKAGFEE